MRSFRKIRSPNKDLMMLQDAVSDVFGELQNNFVADGVLISNVVIGTGNTTIPHTLNRMPLGWFPTRKKGPGDIYEVSINGSNLTLISSVAVTTSLWVY